MAEIAGLLEVEPITGDTYETVSYRSCDLCYESMVEDIWAKNPERVFYFDPVEQLSVCEHCVEGYLREPAHV